MQSRAPATSSRRANISAPVSPPSVRVPPAIGVGLVFGHFLSGALRNPTASDAQFGRAFVGAALAEALGLFAFLVALLLLFALH